MISEEIELNHHLAGAGVDVVETDLGEWVVQLGNDHPSHIVMPIIHRTRHEVADLFKRTAGATDADVADVASMTQFARRTLRPAFIAADSARASGTGFLWTASCAVQALATSRARHTTIQVRMRPSLLARDHALLAARSLDVKYTRDRHERQVAWWRGEPHFRAEHSIRRGRP